MVCGGWLQCVVLRKEVGESTVVVDCVSVLIVSHTSSVKITAQLIGRRRLCATKL
jgi:hypothetical protein